MPTIKTIFSRSTSGEVERVGYKTNKTTNPFSIKAFFGIGGLVWGLGFEVTDVFLYAY